MIENTLGSKKLYKLFLSFIKYVPSILALLQIINLILSYFEIHAFLVTCIGGTSIIFLILLYLISFIFRFCGLYRLSLNYITLITAITTYDFFIGIPLTNDAVYYLYTIISGVFISLWVWIFYKNRKNPKVDHIKSLCERYVCY